MLQKINDTAMFIIENYSTAIIFCIITMLCWGSWANTQKLAAGTWRFELFYWDYAFGILFLSLLFAFTLGSNGSGGRSFIEDISQAHAQHMLSAVAGGIIFNAANILLVAAISIAGMAVAFPVGIGLALVIGVVVNYIDNPVGNKMLLFSGVALIVVAILLNASAYREMQSGKNKTSSKGLLLSVVAGVLMGFFYKYVAASMAPDFDVPTAGKLTPYTALVLFAIGLVVSNFIFNGLLMRFPFSGTKLSTS
ncbi:MAG: multidrug DMT transporter permease, partial [Ginsengibacter sp.]